MVQESQTSRITQIQVRVDCNGCAQKIRKALNDINGIHDLRIDLDRQRVTIIGWADPEKIVKAIKNKARKNATIICSDIEKSSSKATKPKPKPKENASDLDATPQARRTSSSEPMLKATPSSPTPTWHNARQQWQNNPVSEDVEQVHQNNPVSEDVEQVHMTRHNARQKWQNNPDTEDEEQVQMTRHHQPTWMNYVNRFSSGNNYVERRDRRYNNGPGFLPESSRFQPTNVTHSYNTYIPSSYVTEYECVRSSSWHTKYNYMEHYSGVYNNKNVDIDIGAMFSDDNPNACTIV